MIQKIIARNFKGLSFDEDLDQYNLLVGPNGSGKSARAQALQIAILGYLPSNGDKQPSAIYATHGAKVEMIVGFEVNGARYGHRFKPEPTGTISHDVSYKGKKLSERESGRVLMELGDPQVFDLKAFNELSANKKVEFLLERFPPAGNITQLEENILKLEEKEKALRADLRGANSAIERLSMERINLKLPSGTLAEIQAEIKAKEQDLEDAQENLKKQEISEKEKEAAEKARVKAEEKAKKETEAKEKEFRKYEGEAIKASVQAKEKYDQKIQEQMKKVEEALADNLQFAKSVDWSCLASLQTIKDVMVEIGCENCEALAVLNAEIKKVGGEDGSGVK
jgi:energy-coupling factor transporter ATP-binding protein EcfA2